MNALPYVESKIDPDVDWVFIGEETTTTQLEFLLELLKKEKTQYPQIIGRGLFDREPVIIHHFFGVGNKGDDYRSRINNSRNLLKIFDQKLFNRNFL